MLSCDITSRRRSSRNTYCTGNRLDKMEKLLTRDEFREGVFKRDAHKCVICGEPAKDAHHKHGHWSQQKVTINELR